MTSLRNLQAVVGQMRTYITVQQKVNVPGQPDQNSTGGIDFQWVNQFYFWGKVEWSRGWVGNVAERRQPYFRAYIIARFDPRLQIGQRLKFRDMNQDHALTLQSYSNVEQHNWLVEIDAEQGVGT